MPIQWKLHKHAIVTDDDQTFVEGILAQALFYRPDADPKEFVRFRVLIWRGEQTRLAEALLNALKSIRSKIVEEIQLLSDSTLRSS